MSVISCVRNAIIIAAMTVAVAACGEQPDRGLSTTALTGVSVIDVETGFITHDRTIVIRDDLIEYIGDALPADRLGGAAVYDHRGRFVIPGLWDMHIHLRNGREPGSDLAEANARWLRQYLGFGITAVRDAGGDLPDEVLTWKDEIDRGVRRGPRIFTSLRKLDGPEGGWPGSLSLSGPGDIGPALDQLEQMGADFVKLYDGSIDGRLYLDAIAEAERRGLATAGHVPLSVTFEDAIDAGLDSVEHDLYLVKAASAADRQISVEIGAALENGESVSYRESLSRLVDGIEPAKMNRVFDKMIERRAAITPTFHIGRVLDGMTDVSVFESDQPLAEVPPAIRATFAFRATRLTARSPEAVESALALADRNRELLKAAADRGVTVLAGSDTGAVNSYVYPGDSLHNELAELVGAGLSPLDALRAATIYGARWLGVSDRYGSVAPGKIADLLILEENPIEDIGNTRSITAAIQGGDYMNQDELEELRRLAD